MPKVVSKQLDTYHLNEALDRSFICMEIIERLMLEHPIIQSNKILEKKTQEAHQLLFSIYQDIGKLSMNEMM